MKTVYAVFSNSSSVSKDDLLERLIDKHKNHVERIVFCKKGLDFSELVGVYETKELAEQNKLGIDSIVVPIVLNKTFSY